MQDKKKVSFYVGKCDFCKNSFTKIKKLNSGNWSCYNCLEKLANQTVKEYENVINCLWQEGITASQINAKLQAIITTFRYSYNLMDEDERVNFEKELEKWHEDKSDNSKGDVQNGDN